MVRAKLKRRKKIRKEDSIRLRVTTEQKTKKYVTDAATKAGIGLSAWMLTTTLKAAWEILKA